ncbi:transposase [Streptomyces canus]|uniref:transposase n=1 Tax=Streptomyces canus TaxID=58343 RepID=UPI00386457F7
MTAEGYDAGKKINGRKRHIAVDTLGLPMMITVTAGDARDEVMAPGPALAPAAYPPAGHPDLGRLGLRPGPAPQLECRSPVVVPAARPAAQRNQRLRCAAPPLESRAVDRLDHERPPQ